MQVETLMSFDPGGTTGYCVYFVSTKTFVQIAQLEGRHHLPLWDLLEFYQPDVVIYEQFVYQRRDLEKGVALNIDARNYIGILQLYCDKNRAIEHESALAFKKFWNDKKLRQLNLYKSSPHMRDALRHMLYYVTFTLKDDEWVRRLRPGQ